MVEVLIKEEIVIYIFLSKCVLEDEDSDKNDIPTKEDIDFIVDDGYNHDEDPTYEPKDSYSSDDDRYVVTGKEFKKLTNNAKKLGAESFDYSTRKNNKYVTTLSSGKKIHFGSSQYPDFLIHKDKERRERYLARALF